MCSFSFPADPATEPRRNAYTGLRVKRGEVVVVGEPGEPWWIGDVIAVHGGPRDPTVPDFLQVGNLDPTWRVVWVDRLGVLAILDPNSYGFLRC